MNKNTIIAVLVVLVLGLGGYIVWQKNSKNILVQTDTVQKIIESDTSVTNKSTGLYRYENYKGTDYFGFSFLYAKGGFQTIENNRIDTGFNGTAVYFGVQPGKGKPDGIITVANMNFAPDFCSNPKNEKQLLELGFQTPLNLATNQICVSTPGSDFPFPTNFSFDNYNYQNSLPMIIGKYYVKIEAPKETIQEIAKSFVFQPYFMQ